MGSKTPIGIHIGARNVYAAQVRTRRGALAIRSLAQRPLAEPAEPGVDTDPQLTAILKDLCREGRFEGRRAVAHLPSRLIFSFPIRFQLAKNADLEEAIVREAAGYLPFPVEEAVLDYPSVLGGLAPGTHKATIIAARRQDVLRHIALFRKAGLELEAVDFDVSSLIRVHCRVRELGAGPIVLCHVGDQQSLLAVVGQDGILADHHVPWGLDALAAKVTANFETISEKGRARALLRQHGLMHEERSSGLAPREGGGAEEGANIRRALYQIITPYVEELIYELHKIIGYVRSERTDANFEGIYLYGEACSVVHLDQYVGSRLNLKTELMNPVAALKREAGRTESRAPEVPDPAGAAYALALGLALRGAA